MTPLQLKIWSEDLLDLAPARVAIDEMTAQNDSGDSNSLNSENVDGATKLIKNVVSLIT